MNLHILIPRGERAARRRGKGDKMTAGEITILIVMGLCAAIVIVYVVGTASHILSEVQKQIEKLTSKKNPPRDGGNNGENQDQGFISGEPE